MLVERILRGISDTRVVSDHKPGNSPLDELVEQYNRKATHVDELPNITPQSTGLELKSAINLMDSEDQILLLYNYLVACDELPEPSPLTKEAVDENDRRRLQIWLVKGLFVMASAVVCIIAGAVAMIAVRHGQLADNPALIVLMDTAKDIFDVIAGGD